MNQKCSHGNPDACPWVEKLRVHARLSWNQGYKMGVAQMERLLHDARQYAAAVEEQAAVDNERLTNAMLKAEQERDELASELKGLKDF